MNAANTKMNQIDTDDEMRPHYNFDYSKAKPNRFAERYNTMVRHVGLAPDVADQFPTEESVNNALRDYIRITRTPNVEVSTP